MKHLRLFENFEVMHYGSAGIVFVYNNELLLVHSSDENFGTWSYPKGRLDKGEEIIDAAIREVEEEINVSVPKHKVEQLELQETQPLQKSKGIKHYWFYTYYLTDAEFNELFDGKTEIDVNNLQLKEIDQAMFFSKGEAEKILPVKFHEILGF